MDLGGERDTVPVGRANITRGHRRGGRDGLADGVNRAGEGVGSYSAGHVSASAQRNVVLVHMVVEVLMVVHAQAAVARAGVHRNRIGYAAVVGDDAVRGDGGVEVIREHTIAGARRGVGFKVFVIHSIDGLVAGAIGFPEGHGVVDRGRVRGVRVSRHK